QIHKKSKRARDSCGQFAKPGVPGVNVYAFAVLRVKESAGFGGFPRIVASKDGLILWIPLIGELKAALLDPSGKIVLRYFVGIVQQPMIGRQDRDGCVFYRHTIS